MLEAGLSAARLGGGVGLHVRHVPEATGFVAIPGPLMSAVYDAGVRLPLVLELSARVDGAPRAWFVAWGGAPASGPELEVPAALADCVGLPAGLEVRVRARPETPPAARVDVEPIDADDWEVAFANAAELEHQLLNQCGVLAVGQPFPFFAHGRARPLWLRPVAAAPARVVRPTLDTELAIAPLPRTRHERHPSATAGDTTAIESAGTAAVHRLRVQAAPATALRTASFGPDVELTSPDTATAFVPRSLLTSGSGIASLSNPPGKTPALVRIIASDDVADDHVLLAAGLREQWGTPSGTRVVLRVLDDAAVAALARTALIRLHPLSVRASADDDALPPEDIPPETPPGTEAVLEATGEPVRGAVRDAAARAVLAAWLDAHGGELPVSSGMILEVRLPAGRTARFVAAVEAPGGSHSAIVTAAAVRSRRELEVELGPARRRTAPPDRPPPPRTVRVALADVPWTRDAAEDALARLRVTLSPSRLAALASLGPPGAVMLTGSAGTGCTSLALAIADVLQHDLLTSVVAVSCAALEAHEPASARAVLGAAFADARRRAPSVVVLDDLDVLAPGGESADDSSGTVSGSMAAAEALADAMDDCARHAWPSRPVAFLATARSREAVATPLVRSGRFDLVLAVPPTPATRRADVLASNAAARGISTRWTGAHGDLDGFDRVDLRVLLDRAVHAAAGRLLTTPPSTALLPISAPDLEAAREGFVPAAMRGFHSRPPAEGAPAGWDAVGGLGEVRAALTEQLELPMKHAALFAGAPLRLRTGALLYGPPGCGKTLVAKAATEAVGLRCIGVKGPELLNKYIGQSEAGVRDLFTKARAAAPCVLFFDEFDAIAPRRGHDNTGVTDRVVNQLLTELDGVEGLAGVSVLAATSRPDLIDPALLRPGRLDRLLFCGLPNEAERRSILAALAATLPLSQDVDLAAVAAATHGLSGADLRAVLADAQIAAVHASIDARSTASPVITGDHVRDVLTNARASVPEHERARLEALYGDFLAARASGSLPGAAAHNRRGKRATLA